MGTSTTTATWKQEGRVALWRYEPMARMYAGWHFTADGAGCRSLQNLFSLFLSADAEAYRSVTLTDPKSVGADRIFGEHVFRVCFPSKLRLRFDPRASEDHSAFDHADDRLDLSLGRTWIEELGTALADVAHDHADFSLWFEAGKPKDPLKRISFWWWPKDQ